MTKHTPIDLSSALFAAVLLLIAGCGNPYYGAMEKVGVHKRDIMVNRVESARDAQQDAQEQFKSALEQFDSVVSLEETDLKKAYDQRRNFIYNSFVEMGIPVAQPRGAFYIFPYIGDFGLESKEFALRLLDEQKVAAVPGTAFGSDSEGYLRCSYATAMDEIKEAMVRMQRFMGRLSA